MSKITIQAIIQEYYQELQSIYAPPEIQAITYLALEHVLQMSKLQLLTRKEQEVDSVKAQRLKDWLTQLKRHCPIQYLTQTAPFYGLTLRVTPDVLIPRPETEELVDWIKEKIGQKWGKQKINILDIGTGSGCIALALKKILPQATVYALEVSSIALEVAKENANRLALSIEWIQQDIQQEAKWQQLPDFHLIVSNPPYIAVAEKEKMKSNVLNYEPHLALFVAEEQTPLYFYNLIADFAQTKLLSDGYLFFELNEYCGQETTTLMQQKKFTTVQLKKDLQGKARMLCAKKSND